MENEFELIQPVEKSEFEKKAETLILAFEELCKNLEAGTIAENQYFLDALDTLQNDLGSTTDSRGGLDASVWYNYYLAQTYGILSLDFQEVSKFSEAFSAALDDLYTSAGELQEAGLQENWRLKIMDMTQQA